MNLVYLLRCGLVVLVVGLLGACAPGPDPRACQLALHALDPSGGALGERALGPEHVREILPSRDEPTNQVLWLVILTDEGTARFRPFAAAQQGKAVAVLCGDERVSTPVMQDAGAGDRFMFSLDPARAD